jgi:hypothetical protein
MKTMTFALVCLLLTVANVSAQSESQTTNVDSLAGLKGLALSIVINRGDALDETQRTAVSKLLQDDAKARFQKAGIRLLEFAQEIEREPGSPHFMIHITLHTPNEQTYPVRTESRLVQNVRLSRDPSMQISVTTWTNYSIGGGYEVTDTEKLRQQVSGEVDQFIKAYLSVNPAK